MIADELISEIRDRTDIVALIGEYVDLKQRGQNWLGLCPFHNEKSPSFNVHRDRQFFHCFGCKESGDALAFLMRLEGLTFPQAARALAERAGIELHESDDREDEQKRRARARIETLHAIMEAATAFYLAQRNDPRVGAPAVAELERRTVTRATADTFRLGYAPHGWDALSTLLAQKGHSLADAETLGLVVKRRDGSGYYDRFRHRLVFPISDLHGHVVAFSGRILPPLEGREPAVQEPKYVNSPEGPLYKKGELLYGLHEARVEIRRNGWAVLCEGNFDLVSLHQAGVQNVVAPLGTAFTQAQAKLLKRFAQRVTVMFDGDNAGRKAAAAAYPLLTKADLAARVVKLPAGDDPDGFIRRQGAAALTRLIEGASGIVEYLIDAAADSAGAGAAERARAIESLGPIVAAAGNPVEIELYIQRIAQRFSIADLQVVKEQLRRGVRAAPRPPEASQQTKVAAPAERVKLPQLQTELLGALLDQPDLLASDLAGNLKELLTAAELRSIFSAAAAEAEEHGALDASRLLERVGGNAASMWLRERLSVQTYENRAKAEEVLRSGIPLLAKQNVMERELPLLEDSIRTARASGDEPTVIALMKRHVELTRTLSQSLKR